MRALGIEFDEVRVPYLKRDRPEVEELTGQSWVPVLVHGDDVITTHTGYWSTWNGWNRENK